MLDHIVERDSPQTNGNAKQLEKIRSAHGLAVDSALLLKAPFRYIALITVGLPLGAFIFCILYSYLNHYQWVTKTHCNVWNVAPSISASIGTFSPQKYVWKVCISIHTAPRILIIAMYHQYMHKKLIRSIHVSRLIWLCSSAHFTEIFSLLLLSLVPSVENFGLHKLGFTSFLVCSTVSTSTSYFLLRKCRNVRPMKLERDSLRYKKILITVNYTSMVLALYTYWRHNTYCEPGVYSVFSVLEYTVVLSNMFYHFNCYFDFYNMQVNVASLLEFH